MSKTILVVGGTGMLGEPVARRLRADGYQVRIFTRNVEKARAKFGAEYEAVAGDVEDQPSLLAALQGCQAVHVNLDGGLDPDLSAVGRRMSPTPQPQPASSASPCFRGLPSRRKTAGTPGQRPSSRRRPPFEHRACPTPSSRRPSSWRRCPVSCVARAPASSAASRISGIGSQPTTTPAWSPKVARDAGGGE